MQSSVKRPCPGERVTFTCTIPSNGHQWSVPALNISRGLLPKSHGGVITDHLPFQFTVTEVTMESIISTASVNATTDLNGTLVVCWDGIGNKTSQRNTITLRGELCLDAYKY